MTVPGSTTAPTTAPTTTTTSLPPPTGTPGSLFARPACTLYASSSGGGDGNSADSPQTLSAAYSRTVAGSTVCLAPGTYNIATDFNIGRGGSAADGYVTYRSYDASNRAILFASASHGSIVQVTQSAGGYVQFMDLVFDGNGRNGVWGQNGVHITSGSTAHPHHIRFIENVFRHLGAAGIATARGTDYFVAVGNKIWRFGDSAGWSSGISFNNSGGAYWADTAPGFHNLIVGNYIAGGVDNSSNNSDGNGISIDLGGDLPPTLIANNVIYQNGGRCEIDNADTGIHVEINNTCYANGLDTRKSWSEFQQNQSSGVTWTNNIAQDTRSNPRYTVSSGAYTSYHNFGWGGTAGT